MLGHDFNYIMHTTHAHWSDHLPEFSSWTGMIFYSLVFYLLSLAISMALAPLLSPAVDEQYKK